MRVWSANLSQVSVLLFLLAVIFLIQILPQVDLPDTAFHEDTAPVVTKFRSTTGLSFAIAPVPMGVQGGLQKTRFAEIAPLPDHFVSLSLPVLLCSLLC